MIRSTTSLAAGAAILLLLAGCSAPAVEIDDKAPSASDEAAGEQGSSEQYGCTPAMFDYIKDLSYPTAEAVDPTTLEIPDGITIATEPVCLVKDEYGGAPRYGAFFPGDGAEVIAELDAALEAGGYVQSDDYGPYVWWINGDEPTSAEHSVGVGPQVIDGADILWLTY